MGNTAELLKLIRAAPQAFWRHDVDLDLTAAERMACFLENVGIHSVFYVNPRCEFYNPLSRSGQRLIGEIIRHGHEIGLHCEVHLRGVESSVETDLELLRNVAPLTRKVSFHMPPPEVLWRDFESFENAYASKWEGRYLSDSRGESLERTPTNDDQINLHPEWWF